MWPSHTLECQAAVKRKAALTQAAVWPRLEGAVLGAISQARKDTCYDPSARKHLEQVSS